MKKLLVVMLVLAMAGMANAAMELTLSATTVDVGGSITITVSTPVEIPRTVYYIAIDDALSVGDASFDLTNAVINYTGTPSSVNLEDDGGLEGDVGIRPWYVSALLTSVVMPPAVPVPLNGTLISSIKLTGVTAGAVKIALYDIDENAGNTYDITVNSIVPEPITIGLLGLGGLFLRRRK